MRIIMRQYHLDLIDRCYNQDDVFQDFMDYVHHMSWYNDEMLFGICHTEHPSLYDRHLDNIEFAPIRSDNGIFNVNLYQLNLSAKTKDYLEYLVDKFDNHTIYVDGDRYFLNLRLFNKDESIGYAEYVAQHVFKEKDNPTRNNLTNEWKVKLL